MNSEFSVSTQRDLLSVAREYAGTKVDAARPADRVNRTLGDTATGKDGDRVERRQREGVDAQSLNGTVSELNQMVQSLHRELQFQVDKDSGDVVVKVVDTETGDVVRQIPPEEVLRLRERLAKSAGAIFQGSV